MSHGCRSGSESVIVALTDIPSSANFIEIKSTEMNSIELNNIEMNSIELNSQGNDSSYDKKKIVTSRTYT
jgi:hypothetical protein